MLWSDADVTGCRLLEPDIPSLTVNTPVNVKKRSESNVNFIVPMSAVRSMKTVYGIGQQNIAYQSCHIGDHLIATGRGCSLLPPHRDTDVRLDSVPRFPWSCCLVLYCFLSFPLFLICTLKQFDVKPENLLEWHLGEVEKMLYLKSKKVETDTASFFRVTRENRYGNINTKCWLIRRLSAQMCTNNEQN